MAEDGKKKCGVRKTHNGLEEQETEEILGGPRATGRLYQGEGTQKLFGEAIKHELKATGGEVGARSWGPKSIEKDAWAETASHGVLT